MSLILPSPKPAYGTIATNASQSANPSLWDGLVGAWVPSLGNTGSQVVDVVNNNPLTLENNTQWSEGVNGPALLFDGTGDTATSNAGITTDSCTFSAWAIATASIATYDGIVGNKAGWSLNGLTISSYGNSSQGFLLRVNSLMMNTSTFDKTKWFHVVGMYDSQTGELSCYADGVKIGSATGTGKSTANDTIRIGDFYNGGTANSWDGKISDVFAWERVLSPNEIQTLHTDHLAPFRKRQRYFPVSTPAAATTQTNSLITIPAPKPSYGNIPNATTALHPNLRDGLFAEYYPAIGNTGNKIIDLSGHGNHLTVNTPQSDQWQSDYFSWSATTGHYAENTSPNLPSGYPISIAAWVRNPVDENLNYQVVLAIGSTTTVYLGMLLDTASSARAFTNVHRNTAYTPYSSFSNFEYNEWVHVVCTWTEDRREIWVDGVLDKASDAGGWTFPTITEMRMNDWHGTPQEGGIDNRATQLWNKVLTPNEIQTLAADPLAPFRKRQRIYPVSFPAPAATETTQALITIPAPKPSFSNANTGPFKYPSLRDGLEAAWYPQLGSTGSTLHDLVKNADGAITDGAFDKDGFVLNGTSTKAAIPNDQMPQPDFITISTWYKGDGTNNYPPVVCIDDGSVNDYALHIKDSGSARRITLSLQTAGGFWGSTSFVYDFGIPNDPFTEFNHYAATWDGVTARLYFNGVEVASSSSGVSGAINYPGIVNCSIGWDSSTTYLGGTIKNLSIHNRALSANEIKILGTDELALLRKRSRIYPITVAGTGGGGGGFQPAWAYNATQFIGYF